MLTHSYLFKDVPAPPESEGLKGRSCSVHYWLITQHPFSPLLKEAKEMQGTVYYLAYRLSCYNQQTQSTVA